MLNCSSLNFTPKQHLEFLEYRGSVSTSSSPQQRSLPLNIILFSSLKKTIMWFESFYANVQLSKEFNFVNQKMSLAVTWNRNRAFSSIISI